MHHRGSVSICPSKPSMYPWHRGLRRSMTARILIVDDVPANTRLLEAKLKAEYYELAAGRDGFGALRIARSWKPNLILWKVMMPGMYGFECCRLLKDEMSPRHIPVMMITAMGESSERLRGLTVG